MSTLRYVTHPEVAGDPEVPVPEWPLSAAGRRRVAAMLDQPWIRSTGRIVSSPERKAVETATIVADHLGVGVEIRDDTGEIDRSATGFVPHDRHETLADRCFADPTTSADGWETAVDAQHRIVGALEDLLVDDDRDVVVVGHGGVGTLLWCHLAGTPISRTHDQPGQGHHWALDRATGHLLHGWLPIDDV